LDRSEGGRAECEEITPQDLGEREDEMPVRDGSDHLLKDELGPQGGALRRTGKAK